MRSRSVAPSGSPPRVRSVQPFASTAGHEVLEVCGMAGLFLDGWQQDVLVSGLGERPDGKWTHFEVATEVSRQNGKGGILEARQLGGLYVLGERLIVHSSHQFDTSLEAFRRLLALIEDTPELDQRVKRVSRSHGEEGIELKGGQRIRFRTRTKGGGRGFTGDCLILDEAMFLPETAIGALLPTLSARPNPQVWYMGSAVDQMVHPDGIVFARIRERGLTGTDPSLAYFEWSVDADTPDEVTEQMADDPRLWAQANPALGIRISREHVERERRSMDPRTFAVERLGVGDWPRTDGLGEAIIDAAVWDSLEDKDAVATDPVWFAFDVTPSRSHSVISVASYTEDGHPLIEIAELGKGTGWLVDKLMDLQKHKPAGFVCDERGPAASLLTELAQKGVKVTTTNSTDLGRACGMLVDKAQSRQLRHHGQQELTSALRGAVKRPLVDAFAFSRRHSTANISPLVACTLALWGLLEGVPSVYERRGILVM